MCDLDYPLFSWTRTVNLYTIFFLIFFLGSGQKACIFRRLRDRKRRVFSPLTKKNRIRPSSISKECPKSQFTILGFASEGNLRAIWAILYFSGHGLEIYYSLLGSQKKKCKDDFFPLAKKTRVLIYKKIIPQIAVWIYF